MFIAFALMFVVGLFAASVGSPKDNIPKPASLSELDAPTAEPGRPLPVVFGTVRMKAPNIVWYGDLGNSPIRVEGGK